MTTNNSKTFRLFISSTFSDFQAEREVLQTKVFPEIKEYCSSKGYTFQPIDLRWGVSNEAQLDQKALEMCIKEVQSCKRYDYPNFLIMLGDRYGWIPLPNIIEKSEFEQILQNIDEKDKEYILSWYFEDANQVPASYMLEQRTDEYEDYNKWLEIETKLRDILQTAVSSLSEDIKKKYFTSATEAEAIEGIISYSQKSEFQQKLLKLIPDLEQIDYRNIFGFFRNIEKSSIIEDRFVSTDYEKASFFKEQVQEKLIDENTLNVSTSQVSKERLDESYLEKFIESVTNFLKQQIDKQVLKDNKQDYSDLELEKLQQEFFMNKKLENFLGQEKSLSQIQSYINGDNDKPLIISGPSGIGKSSIMAKAIEDISMTSSIQVVYRFIGATIHSGQEEFFLESILGELNPDLINYFTDNIGKSNDLIESYIKLHYLINDEIMKIKTPTVIFIDGYDQLNCLEHFQDVNSFLWMPKQLPTDVKIIISTLKDNNYSKENNYYYDLKEKDINFIEIKRFDKPLELLELLLLQNKRTLQDEQKQYFYEQYNQVNTPLYVLMAASQILAWKSIDKPSVDVVLAKNQIKIIEIFLKNLNEKYHHDKLLIQKVLAFITISKEGLSEYEILELLNINQDFIKSLVLNIWHQNTTQKLPLVIWTRLYSHIKPFLKKGFDNNQELIYFFHREFITVINKQLDQEEEHQFMIKAINELLLENKNNSFNNNRWGKLHLRSLIEYYKLYGSINNFLDVSTSIHFMNDNWVYDYLKYAIYLYGTSKDLSLKSFILDYLINIFEKKIKKNHVKFLKLYMNFLSLSDDIEVRRKAFEISKYYFNKYPNNIDIIEVYIDSINQLASLLENDENKVKELTYKALHILNKLFFHAHDTWCDYYIRQLYLASNLETSILETYNLSKKSYNLFNKYYKEKKKDYFHLYIDVSTSYIKSLFNYKDLHEEYFKISNELLVDAQAYLSIKPTREYIQKYAYLIYIMAINFEVLNKKELAFKLKEENFFMIKKKYFEVPENYFEYYVLVHFEYINILDDFNMTQKILELLGSGLTSVQKKYEKKPDLWINKYLDYLKQTASAYSSINMNSKSLELFEKAYIISEDRFKQNNSAEDNEYFDSLLQLTFRVVLLYPNSIERNDYLMKKVENYIKINYTTQELIGNISFSQFDYLIGIYINSDKLMTASNLITNSLKTIKVYFSNNPKKWNEQYIAALNQLYKINIKLECFGEVVKILNDLIPMLNTKSDMYFEVINDYIFAHLKLGIENMPFIERYVEENLRYVLEKYTKNNEKYLLLMFATYDIAVHYYESIENYDKQTNYYINLVEILEKLYLKEPDHWEETYCLDSLKLSYYFINNKLETEGMNTLRKSMKALSTLYNKNPSKWKKDFEKAKTILKDNEMKFEKKSWWDFFTDID